MIEQITPSRILYFEFFSNIFLYELLLKNQDTLQNQLTLLSQEPLVDKEYYQKSLKEIEENFPKILQEYTLLFSTPFSRQKLSLYLSSFIENCISGESLVRVREKLKERKLLLDREFCKENEDHLGVICLFMIHLLKEGDLNEAKEISSSFFLPIAEGLIEQAKKMNEEKFYFNVIKILEGFVSVEKIITSAST